ncbi:hypothetical protein IFR09_11140 [Pseudomonas syringae]|nr:hypothetical protein [Pseudomonas syringae]MBD8801931.1 hypothetical protein [Pseudomonas syringae]MBD8811719.1 hypothetical protein [Pseudomonas syringae]
MRKTVSESEIEQNLEGVSQVFLVSGDDDHPVLVSTRALLPTMSSPYAPGMPIASQLFVMVADSHDPETAARIRKITNGR